MTTTARATSARPAEAAADTATVLVNRISRDTESQSLRAELAQKIERLRELEFKLGELSRREQRLGPRAADPEIVEKTRILLREKRRLASRVRHLTAEITGGRLRHRALVPGTPGNPTPVLLTMLSGNPNAWMRTTDAEIADISQAPGLPREQPTVAATNNQSLRKIRSNLQVARARAAEVARRRDKLDLRLKAQERGLEVRHSRWASLHIERPTTLVQRNEELVADGRSIALLHQAITRVRGRQERLTAQAHDTRTRAQTGQPDPENPGQVRASNPARQAFAEAQATGLEQEVQRLETEDLRYLEDELAGWTGGGPGAADAVREQLRVARNDVADAEALIEDPGADTDADELAAADATVAAGPDLIQGLEAKLGKIVSVVPGLPGRRLDSGTQAARRALPTSLTRYGQPVRGVDNFTRTNKRLRNSLGASAAEVGTTRQRKRRVQAELDDADSRVAEFRRVEAILLGRITDPAVGGDAPDDGEYV
jgi:hypothetical protein